MTGQFIAGLSSVTLAVSSLLTTPQHVAPRQLTSTPFQLEALITPASSTSEIVAIPSFYGQDWSAFGAPQVVPFLFGPQGIEKAIENNSTDPTGVVLLASGWGAGQTGSALAAMQADHDPSIKSIHLAILDNDTNRAGGGFWTTYWFLAPLLHTSAAAPPSETDVPIIDTAYQYNINSDAPTYPINLLADANSLAAYLEGYGAAATAPMPARALQPVVPGDPHYHYIVAPDGIVTQKVAVPGNITYVTFASDGLPLLAPLRLLPGGNILADAVQPVLTALVNWGYQDNDPIPDNPTTTRPAGLLPSLSEDLTAVEQLAAAIGQSLRVVQRDLPSLDLSSKLPVSPGDSSIAVGVAPSRALAGGAVIAKHGQALGAPGHTAVPAVPHVGNTPGRSARPADTVSGPLLHRLVTDTTHRGLTARSDGRRDHASTTSKSRVSGSSRRGRHSGGAG